MDKEKIISVSELKKIFEEEMEWVKQWAQCDNPYITKNIIDTAQKFYARVLDRIEDK